MIAHESRALYPLYTVLGEAIVLFSVLPSSMNAVLPFILCPKPCFVADSHPQAYRCQRYLSLFPSAIVSLLSTMSSSQLEALKRQNDKLKEDLERKRIKTSEACKEYVRGPCGLAFDLLTLSF